MCSNIHISNSFEIYHKSISLKNSNVIQKKTHFTEWELRIAMYENILVVFQHTLGCIIRYTTKVRGVAQDKHSLSWVRLTLDMNVVNFPKSQYSCCWLARPPRFKIQAKSKSH